MRRLAVLGLLVAALAAGCGGGGSKSGPAQSHSILEVSKAFYDQGIGFTQETTFNPYVNGQAVFLPGKLNTGNLRDSIQALLTQTSTANFTGAIAWVFDSDAHAEAALKIVPLKAWAQGSPPIVRVHDGNVIVTASGFRGDLKKKLDAALATLQK
ncbi:MAG: hypothetical protein ACYDCH_04265 [Gaiellaceae bacterium]